ncbi:MAG TPA: phosphate acyltransferase PlsX [Armatimonadota bacterium]|nr:phosphate acyltransferase PlsX [Armatimonadota bacterium]
MKIAVDAMGGDLAPAAAVDGALTASREFGLEILLVGRPGDVKPLLDKRGGGGPRIELVEASEVVEMHDAPAQAVRRKKDASLVVCADLVKEGRAAAMFSAGNTGAGMAVSLFKLGRIPGIERPALAILLPNRGGLTVLLDAGANVDVPPLCLQQYAVMGSIYARELLGVPEPRVGLVNIGEEEGKGNELARDAFMLLNEAPVRFIGNVEGPDLFNGRVDVAVCDGFTGNVILKVGEGVAEFLKYLIKDEIERSPVLKLPAALLAPAFRRIHRRTDYGERGGAPLLGVNGICLIGHGRSNSTAISNAIRTAAEAVRHGVIDKIREQIAPRAVV